MSRQSYHLFQLFLIFCSVGCRILKCFETSRTLWQCRLKNSHFRSCHRRCSKKKVLSKISQNSFLRKLQACLRFLQKTWKGFLQKTWKRFLQKTSGRLLLLFILLDEPSSFYCQPFLSAQIVYFTTSNTVQFPSPFHQ